MLLVRHSARGLAVIACFLALSVDGFGDSQGRTSSWRARDGEPLPKHYDVRLATKTYKVTLNARPALGWSSEERLMLWGHGGSGGVPSPVTLLSISRNGAKVYVRRSAYADLSQVVEVKLNEDEEGLTILISGGDASESYEALIRVKGVLVVEREVRWAIFPEAQWEKTVYVNKKPDYDD